MLSTLEEIDNVEAKLAALRKKFEGQKKRFKAKPPLAKRKKSSNSRKPKGRHYNDEEKAEIVKFYKDFAKENESGAFTATIKKFGVTYPTIVRWLEVS